MTTIIFAGVDGGGKSTQAKLLYDHFLAQGKNVHLFREPGGTPFGEGVRKMLIENTCLNSLTKFFLFQAARSELYMKMQELLYEDSNAIFILDRSWICSIAYQGEEIGSTELKKMMNATPFPETSSPDLVIFLDPPVNECVERCAVRGENESESGLFKISVNYDNFLRRSGLRYVQIKSSEKEEVRRVVLEEVEKLFVEDEDTAMLKAKYETLIGEIGK